MFEFEQSRLLNNMLLDGDKSMFAIVKTITYTGNASPAAIRKSSGISGIIDHGTGKFTVTFTDAFPDANYQVSAMILVGSNANHGHVTEAATTGALDGSFRFYTGSSTTTLTDGQSTRMTFTDV